MQAITTTAKKGVITARTASGKTATIQARESFLSEDMHQAVARKLSKRMGWGENLVGGETKEGFAYIPVQKDSGMTVEMAVKQLTSAASAFPVGEKDPIRLASGIRDLMKA